MVNQYYHIQAELDGFVSLRDNQNRTVFMMHSDAIEPFLTDSDEYDQALRILTEMYYLQKEEEFMTSEMVRFPEA